MQKTINKNYFLSQPHQPFFILGIINSIIMMLIFSLSYKGIFTLYTDILTFHTYTLIFTVFTNLFTGFIFTTFPRFCQSNVIEKDYYVKLFFANLIGSGIFLLGVFLNEMLMQFGMFILFVANIFIVSKLYSIYTNGQAVDKKDAFWILLSFCFGLLGHFLFIVSSFAPMMQTLAISISFYLYIIFLTFSVAQRMIPFFSHSFEAKSEKLILTVFTLFVLRILASFFEIPIAQISIDLILAIYLFREFISWKFTPLKSPAILWVLQLGLFWLPTAFLLSAFSLIAQELLETNFYFFNVHLLAIGFLTTILIGFGTRVTLGHSSQPPHADKFAVGLFIFIQVVVLIRSLFSFNIAFGWELNFLFDISFTTWLILFILWGARYGKVLLYGTRLN